MKNYILIFLLCIYAFAKAQETTTNTGNIQIHDEGQIGFHGDLINNGNFDNNKGLAGFYNDDESLSISGTNEPVFFDMEVAVDNDLVLNVSTGVTGILDYINGRILTPRGENSIFLDFTNDAIYTGEDDDRHTDGYARNRSNLAFTFPIGDDFRLRSLSTSATAQGDFKAAYFFEDPNNPTAFGDFDTDRFEPLLSIVSTKEFWDLDGDKTTQATLTWDDLSDIPVLADDISSLRVVGFDSAQDRWVDLGQTTVTGDLQGGSITSEPFIPNTYEALTFGSLLKGNGSIDVYTIITPNGDGMNDTLIIEGIGTNSENVLHIYNRWGVEVYRKVSYDNSFSGISSGRSSVRAQSELPVGTYYYVLKLEGQKDIAGAFYINR